MAEHSNSIVIFHPSTAPFVQEAALALYESGLLSAFVTTLRDNPNSRVQRTLCALVSSLGYDLKKQFSRRVVTRIPESHIRDWPQREFSRLIVGKCDPSGILTDIIWEWAETGFDRRVATTYLDKITAIYGYEHASAESFTRAKAAGLCCIYDVQAPEHDYTHAIIDRELAKYPAANSWYQRYIRMQQKRRTARRRVEWEHADRVIAASNFTKDSFALAGLDTSKVRVIPYGAPPTIESGIDGGSDPSEQCRFLWAGTFNIRKGAPYLLEAWRTMPLASKCELIVYGAQRMPAQLLENLPDSIKFAGSVPALELREAYLRADVLVFPTLCDGFGMVVTEAFAHGLPVITTRRAGAAELLIHESNGLLINAESATELRDALQWCLDNRIKLKEMRSSALATARRWQWADYRKMLAAIVRESITSSSLSE